MTGSLEQAPAPAGARRARPRTGRLPVMTDTTRTGLPPAAPLRPEGLRLIAVDMDGTFLGAGMPGTYDRARFAPLRRRMRERGVRFVVASGNQEHQIAGYFEGDVGGAALSPDGQRDRKSVV